MQSVLFFKQTTKLLFNINKNKILFYFILFLPWSICGTLLNSFIFLFLIIIIIIIINLFFADVEIVSMPIN